MNELCPEGKTRDMELASNAAFVFIQKKRGAFVLKEEGQRNERTLPRGQSEGYGACSDDRGVYRFRRGYGGETSGRMRLSS